MKGKASSEDIPDVRSLYARVAASYSVIASGSFWGHYSHPDY